MRLTSDSSFCACAKCHANLAHHEKFDGATASIDTNCVRFRSRPASPAYTYGRGQGWSTFSCGCGDARPCNLCGGVPATHTSAMWKCCRRPATEVSRDGDNSRDPQGLVHDARTAWLFTGDTRVWEVSKKGWWRTVGGWGVVLVLLLPFGGLFAAISALSILKQFDSNLVDQTSPPGHCITNIIVRHHLCC